MLPQPVQDALNDQINRELTASYNYLAMATYCRQIHFYGFADWLAAQSQEEYGHAMKLYDFLIARNGKVELQALSAPKSDFSSLVHVFEEALAQEESVSQHIDAIYELAAKEKAFAALVELQWFITEQVEEEKTFRAVLGKMKMLQDDPSALLDMDREMGTRGGGPPEEGE
jgi:ferritin